MGSVGRGVWNKKELVSDCWQLTSKSLTKLFELTDAEGTQDRLISAGTPGRSYISFRLIIWGTGVMQLHYTTTNNYTGEKREMRYDIRREWTPCNFGGRQWWLFCPVCSRRCRILYLPPSGYVFACRVCYNLTYESQQKGMSNFRKMMRAAYLGEVDEYRRLYRKLLKKEPRSVGH